MQQLSEMSNYVRARHGLDQPIGGLGNLNDLYTDIAVTKTCLSRPRPMMRLRPRSFPHFAVSVCYVTGNLIYFTANLHHNSTSYTYE